MDTHLLLAFPLVFPSHLHTQCASLQHHTMSRFVCTPRLLPVHFVNHSKCRICPHRPILSVFALPPSRLISLATTRGEICGEEMGKGLGRRKDIGSV
ncbi:hypothetical protein B0H13DRAFT_1023695 [Mycena leptocephala]|nr:hypothetical protein B0H13DRAFT_1023695 [Mycena leptocephala]